MQKKRTQACWHEEPTCSSKAGQSDRLKKTEQDVKTKCICMQVPSWLPKWRWRSVENKGWVERGRLELFRNYFHLTKKRIFSLATSVTHTTTLFSLATLSPATVLPITDLFLFTSSLQDDLHLCASTLSEAAACPCLLWWRVFTTVITVPFGFFLLFFPLITHLYDLCITPSKSPNNFSFCSDLPSRWGTVANNTRHHTFRVISLRPIYFPWPVSVRK